MFAGDREATEYLQRFDAAMERLNAAGFRPNPSSRVFQYRKHIEAWDRRGQLPPDPAFREFAFSALNAMAELNQIIPILEAAPGKIGAEDLAKVFGGNASGHQDRNGEARNFQSQYFLAAILNRAGISCTFGQTDMTFAAPTGRAGIEAKRITSRAEWAVERRLREGTKQLARRGVRGLVALDASRVLSGHTEYLVAADEKGALRLVGDRTRSLAFKVAAAAAARPDASLDGVIVWASAAGLVYGVGLWTGTEMAILNVSKHPDSHTAAVGRMFGRAVRDVVWNGLPNFPTGFRVGPFPD